MKSTIQKKEIIHQVYTDGDISIAEISEYAWFEHASSFQVHFHTNGVQKSYGGTFYSFDDAMKCIEEKASRLCLHCIETNPYVLNYKNKGQKRCSVCKK
jgi:hypothetical protein